MLRGVGFYIIEEVCFQSHSKFLMGCIEKTYVSTRLVLRRLFEAGSRGLVQSSLMRLRSAAVLALIPCVALNAHEPVRARHGMVVAEEPLAAGVGVSVLQRGGNAVDAAVAVGFALAVTHPYAGNIGGGGFMLIRFADGRSTFIDFRERAPGKASRDMYLDARGNPTRDSIDGWRSAAVPGTVRGFELAETKYGRAKWAELIAPAIELASKGFPLSYQAAGTMRAAANMSADPESRRIFQNNGAFFEPGDILAQPDLANTLDRIARHGAREFYQGRTAQRLAAEMARHGGLITLDDLKNYAAVERTPLTGKYRDFGIITAPPPSSGGVGLLQMLGMLEGTGYEKTGAGSAASIHYVAEVMRRFFADRSRFLGDPDSVNNPIKGLLDPAYIRARRASIDPDHATPSAQLGPGQPAAEGSETTHYSIVDSEGNAVAVTYTLNNGYGSGVTVPGLGFLLNDEMDDFTAKPGAPNLFGLVQGEANAIAPGKRPLSAMTPTIVTRQGKLFMVLGAPGGPRIITAVLQTFLNVADFGMNIQDAVDAPRFHHQWKPDRLYLEPGISPDTVALLKARGHQVEYSPGVVLARVEAILSEGGWLQGAADSRWVGKASGY
jgi:gamma-glutamyltranspeptidase/glutathione hydrolase